MCRAGANLRWGSAYWFLVGEKGLLPRTIKFRVVAVMAVLATSSNSKFGPYDDIVNVVGSLFLGGGSQNPLLAKESCSETSAFPLES